MPRLPLSRRVVCPSCGAVVGAFCVNADGEPFTKGGSHKTRDALARSQPIPETAWLLTTCQNVAPGLAWRAEGASVVAERGALTVEVSASRIRLRGSHSATHKTRRAWLGSTLTRVLLENP